MSCRQIGYAKSPQTASHHFCIYNANSHLRIISSRGGFVAWPIADSSVRPWHPLERVLNRDLRSPSSPPPTRSSPGAGGASVSCRSDINNDATSLVVIDSTPVCHGYSDALCPEWPRQVPAPNSRRDRPLQDDDGWTYASRHSLVFHHCASIGARFSSACFFSHLNMTPTQTVGRVTRLQWPFLTPSSHVPRVSQVASC